MTEKPIEALMLSFGDSALVFRVRCWIEHQMETCRVIDKTNTALHRALSEAQIESPTPGVKYILRMRPSRLSLRHEPRHPKVGCSCLRSGSVGAEWLGGHIMLAAEPGAPLPACLSISRLHR